MFQSTRSTPQALPDELAVQMMPTIRRIARKLARRLPPHIGVEDLVGAGCQGLVTAYTRSNDRTFGGGFGAFADRHIRGAMLDELRTTDSLTRDQRTHTKQATAATRALHARLGRSPGSDEIAAELGISLDAYWERQLAASTKVTTGLGSDDEQNLARYLRDPHAEPADDCLCRKEKKDAVDRAIAALPPRLARILELHYVEGVTLHAIGEQLGVTESRIWQLQTDAVRRIRELCQDHAPTALAA